MEIVNEFVVPVTRDRAWDVLTNLETVAECLPGAKLTRREGDDYLGTVRVKVGPITATYSGKARFVSLEKSSYRAELSAEGRETKGQGNASANIVAELVPEGEGTRVTVTVNLTIAGKVAQFGRGVLGEVSEKLMAQFAKNLEASVMKPVIGDETIEIEEILNSDETIQIAEVLTTSDGEVEEVVLEVSEDETNETDEVAADEAQDDSNSINGLRLIAKPIAKRVAPVFAAAVVVAIVLRRRGSKRHS